MNHKQRLGLLTKISRCNTEDNFRGISAYFIKIENARKIHKRRNTYLHSLTLIEEEEQKHHLKKTQYLSVKQRHYLEELMHGFIDVHESGLWFGMQNRLVSNIGNTAAQIIQEALQKIRVRDDERERRQSLLTVLSNQFLESDKQSFNWEEIRIILESVLGEQEGVFDGI